MGGFSNAQGQCIVMAMVSAIQENKTYLSEVDGLVGDGDHGANMNKGFSLCAQRLEGRAIGFTDALDELGTILFSEIGGSMGPIYGTLFMGMATAAADATVIDAAVFGAMLDAGVAELEDIVEARVGDKTLMDALLPARDAFAVSTLAGEAFTTALDKMRAASAAGMEATRDMVAKFGRSSRLGERSRGVLDAGAVSCDLIVQAMASSIVKLLS